MHGSPKKYEYNCVCFVIMVDQCLTWEDTFAIVQFLRAQHPGVNLEQITLGNIYEWTTQLPDFHDDRALANEGILLAIIQEWFEELSNL